MKDELKIDGVLYRRVEKEEADESGNVNCVGCDNSTGCYNSAWCDNSTGCDNSTRCDNSTGCDNSAWCYNSAWCDNSTGCDNSTRCDNSAYCLFCSDLVLEKYMVFNKPVKPDEYKEIHGKVFDELGWTHPTQLTDNQKMWLKKNVKQYDEEVLERVIAGSVLLDKPKGEKG